MLFTEKTFDKCLNNLINNNIKAILFTGTNYGLAGYLADKIVNVLRPIEKIFLDYQDIDKNFAQTLQPMLENDFFSTKRIIKIYNVKNKANKELQFLTKENIANTIIDKLIILFGTADIDGRSALKLLFDKSQKNLACISCYDDDEQKAIEVIKEFFAERKFKINNDAVIAMAKMLHGDRNLLISECEKMALYCNKNKNITINEINLAIQNNQEASPFAFSDYLLSGDVKSAIQEFDELCNDDAQIIQIMRLFLKVVNDILIMKQDIVYNGKNIDNVIKEHFVFFKRMSIVKKILTVTNVQTIENYIKIAIQTEKMAKIYSDEIAKQYFIKNAILSKLG